MYNGTVLAGMYVSSFAASRMTKNKINAAGYSRGIWTIRTKQVQGRRGENIFIPAALHTAHASHSYLQGSTHRQNCIPMHMHECKQNDDWVMMWVCVYIF